MENENLQVENYDKLIATLNNSIFCVPKLPANGVFFPRYVYQLIDEWIEYFVDNISPVISPFINALSTGSTDDMFIRLTMLKEGINNTLITYYQGDTFGAVRVFNTTLDNAYVHSMSVLDATLPTNHEFYRARINEKKDFTRSDLFHIPFEERHRVSTNRYSIPGLPALYLGGSVYVCWEEFSRHPLKEMWFARFETTEELNITKLLRISDFIEELKDKAIEDAIHHIWQYLAIFPIIIACTILVEHSNNPFKPEYIIPQMLLRYVKEKNMIDGIMYPSTKVDYTKIKNIAGYNYVFPVKTVDETGFCIELKKNFAVSEPTSIELEDLIFKSDQVFLKSQFERKEGKSEPSQIKLKEDSFILYEHTSFGFIEQRLKNGQTKILD